MKDYHLYHYVDCIAQIILFFKLKSLALIADFLHLLSISCHCYLETCEMKSFVFHALFCLGESLNSRL